MMSDGGGRSDRHLEEDAFKGETESQFESRATTAVPPSHLLQNDDSKKKKSQTLGQKAFADHEG